MKVIRHVVPRCSCTEKLWDYHNTEQPDLGIGSIIECDCGSQYTLSDSQRDGKFWVKRAIRDRTWLETEDAN